MKQHIATSFNLSPETVVAYTDARTDMIKLVTNLSGNILDVGCATGSTGRSLKCINPKIYLCGIEYNDELGMVAKRHYDQVVIGDLDLLEF